MIHKIDSKQFGSRFKKKKNQDWFRIDSIQFGNKRKQKWFTRSILNNSEVDLKK